MASTPVINLRKGNAVRYNNGVCIVIEMQHKTPPNLRAFVQMSIRNLDTGKVYNLRLTPNDSLESVNVTREPYEFSYTDPAGYHFLHQDTYEDVTVSENLIADLKTYLVEGQIYTLVFTEGSFASIELPSTMEMTIAEAPEGVKGDSANNVYKAAVTADRPHRPGPPLHQPGRPHHRQDRGRLLHRPGVLSCQPTQPITGQHRHAMEGCGEIHTPAAARPLFQVPRHRATPPARSRPSLPHLRLVGSRPAPARRDLIPLGIRSAQNRPECKATMRAVDTFLRPEDTEFLLPPSRALGTGKRQRRRAWAPVCISRKEAARRAGRSATVRRCHRAKPVYPWVVWVSKYSCYE